MTTGTNLGRAGSPLPAARPFANHGAHGLSRHSHATAEVTRRTTAPISAGNWYNMDGFRNYFYISGALALLMVTSFCGCVTKSQARAQSQAAYLAGQNDALAKMAGLGQGIVIVGPVEHPNVPWVAGLTLSQAIATANYTGRHNPKEITITRQGEQASINPKDLLNGHVVPLEPGDTITIRE
jgi:hypothetical protein